MIRIERAAEHITALAHVILAELLAPRLHVVAALAQTRELIDWRIRFTAAIDWCPMINGRRRLDVAQLQAGLAQWI